MLLRVAVLQRDRVAVVQVDVSAFSIHDRLRRVRVLKLLQFVFPGQEAETMVCVADMARGTARDKAVFRSENVRALAVSRQMRASASGACKDLMDDIDIPTVCQS